MSRSLEEHTNVDALRVEGLRTWFFTDEGVVPSVDGVSFHVNPGETLCIVGESGCGKSVTALSIMGLVASPPGRIVEGSVKLGDTELTTLRPRELRKIRGRRIAMIFQEPMSSLNPVFTVGSQIVEALRLHLELSRDEARARAIELLEQVGIPDPERRVDEYPHQMSGGMKQRVMIAMALSCDPDILIADEPTTALDVTIQAQILELLNELQRSRGMSVILITHDLGVVAEIADRVLVMYAGQVIEEAGVYDLFERPRHPYTRGLLASLPSLRTERGERLATIEGMVPAPLKFPSGCRFRTRCTYATERCADEVPTFDAPPGAHRVSCHFGESIIAGTKGETGPISDPRTIRKLKAGSRDGWTEEVVGNEG